MSPFTVQIPDSLRNKLNDDADQADIPVAWLARRRLWGEKSPELTRDGRKKSSGVKSGVNQKGRKK